MNCAACGEKFNDGVQCSSCKNQYDFGCANITESGFRRLGAERRASWKCSTCRLRSPSPLVTVTPALSPEVSLESIMMKLNAMALNLESLPKLIHDVKEIKADISSLQESSKGIHKKIQEFDTKVHKLDSRITSLETTSNQVKDLKAQMGTFQHNEILRDQWSRLNNVVKGVPLKKSENLYAIVESIGSHIKYKITKNHINYVSRVPSYSNNEKSIVVSFLNRYVKEDFIASARLVKSINLTDLGFSGDSNRRIYVNDHLAPEYKKLLNKTKQLAKEKDFAYVWGKFSKIHIRKNDTSHVIVVNSDNDLNKLA